MISYNVDCLISGNIVCHRKWGVIEDGAVYHRLYFVLGGETVYKDNEKDIMLKKNHIYLFPTQRPYCIRHNPDNPLRCIWFHILLTPFIVDSMLYFDVGGDPAAFYLLKAAESVIDTDKTDNVLLAQLLGSLIMLFDRKFKLSVSNDIRLVKALKYIHKNINEKLTNISISNEIGLDMYYFIRLFKKTFGMSPQKYISDFRLKNALVLLKNGALVEEVSGKSGFLDSKAFSRAFKKHFGFPPSKCKSSQYLQP